MSEKTKIFDEGSKELKTQTEPAITAKDGKLQGMKTAGAIAGGVVLGNLAWGLALEAKEAVNEYTTEPSNLVSEEVEAIETDQADAAPQGGIAAAEVSDVVTDDMSFSEAFTAARADIGPGGVFEWNGNLYGTYYKEEWDSLSPEETEEYWASVEAADVDIEQEVMPENIQNDEMMAEAETFDINGDGYEESIALDTNDDGELDVIASDLDGDGRIDTVVADTDYNGEPDIIIQETNMVEVEALYASETNEAGTISQQPEMETADLDGDGYEESILADTNADGNFDMVAADLNMDGKIDTIAADTNHDGQIDEITVDTDGDGEADYYESTDETLTNSSETGNNELASDFENDSDMAEWA